MSGAPTLPTSHGKGVLLSCRRYGLGKPQGTLLQTLKHSRYFLLYDALEEAISLYGTPRIFNTDQGSQFTSDGFTGILKKHDIRISMDGRGRWMDNVFIERLWKSVKYEDVYLKAYDSIATARKELANWFTRYNMRRHHQGLDEKTLMRFTGVFWPEIRKAV